MQSLSDQKKAHALRMNVTTEDERMYREPTPLTDEQKEKLLSEQFAMRLASEENARLDKAWRERRYADKTDKEEQLW